MDISEAVEAVREVAGVVWLDQHGRVVRSFAPGDEDRPEVPPEVCGIAMRVKPDLVAAQVDVSDENGPLSSAMAAAGWRVHVRPDLSEAIEAVREMGGAVWLDRRGQVVQRFTGDELDDPEVPPGVVGMAVRVKPDLVVARVHVTEENAPLYCAMAAAGWWVDGRLNWH